MNSTLPPKALAQALWILTARTRGAKYWLSNADCEMTTIEIAGNKEPVSILNSPLKNQSYVISLKSCWIDYARDEAIRHLPERFSGIAKLLISCILSPISALIKIAGLEQAISISNRLISTNLYPDWTLEEIQEMLQKLLKKYPNRPLIFRNICPEINPILYEALQYSGWKLIPTRQIYLCDPQLNSVWKHNHVKKDAKLLNSAELKIIPPEQIKASDLSELRELFRQLFIHKHSHLNPDFTPEFFNLCHENGFLDLYGLKLNEKMVGVIGLYEHNGWLTTPLIGYDTSIGQEYGIYRCLMALLLQQAKLRKTKLHYSSGASRFKMARGGISCLEYTAIYSKHLPTSKRWSCQLLEKIMQKTVPAILKKTE